MYSECFVFNFSRAFMRDICSNKFPKYCSVFTKQRERGTISNARYIYDYPGMELVTRSLHYPIINLMNTNIRGIERKARNVAERNEDLQ